MQQRSSSNLASGGQHVLPSPVWCAHVQTYWPHGYVSVGQHPHLQGWVACAEVSCQTVGISQPPATAGGCLPSWCTFQAGNPAHLARLSPLCLCCRCGLFVAPALSNRVCNWWCNFGCVPGPDRPMRPQQQCCGLVRVVTRTTTSPGRKLARMTPVCCCCCSLTCWECVSGPASAVTSGVCM